MRKILLFIISLILVTGCNDVNDNKQETEKFLIGHTLEDGRIIHFTFDVPYNNTYISEALSSNEITIDEFINNLEYLDSYNDGGSKIYQYNKDKKIYGKENFYVISCNSLDNIKDIYVAKYKESLSGVCSKNINEIENITMSIKEGTLTKTSATVIIKDISERDNIYGESFTIEKYDHGWIELESKNDMVFNSIGYSVGKDNTLELDVKWDYFYGELKSEKYRILKDFSESGEGVRHYISAEFTIE